MSNPQQPELARSRKTPAQDPDAAAAVLEGQRQPSQGGPGGPVPPDNQPGHHPEKEQDKPDPNAFAAKLGLAAPDAGAQPPPDPGPAAGRGPLVTPMAWPAAKRLRPPQAAFVAAAAGALLTAFLVVRRRKRRRA